MNRICFAASLAVLMVGPVLSFVAEAPAAPKRDYRAVMREFVQAISGQAKKTAPEFIIVPQGGTDLLTQDGKPAADYLKAIDGIGQEEVFYGYDNKDNRKTPQKETDAFLKQLVVAKTAGKVVLSIDYASKKESVDDAYSRNAAAGFIPFVADHRGLDNVPKYPEKPVNQNAADVKALKDAKNFLYVIHDVEAALAIEGQSVRGIELARLRAFLADTPQELSHGFMAVLLWQQFRRTKDRGFLETLLAYNVEDAVNLEALMVEAFNRHLTGTPFTGLALAVPTPPLSPFRVDPGAVAKVGRRMW